MQSVCGDAGQGAALQLPGQFGECQSIAGGCSELGRQMRGVCAEDSERDRLRTEVGGQGEQLQSGRRVAGEPVEGDLIGSGQ